MYTSVLKGCRPSSTEQQPPSQTCPRLLTVSGHVTPDRFMMEHELGPVWNWSLVEEADSFSSSYGCCSSLRLPELSVAGRSLPHHRDGHHVPITHCGHAHGAPPPAGRDGVQTHILRTDTEVEDQLTRRVAPRDRSPVECRANFRTLKILISLKTCGDGDVFQSNCLILSTNTRVDTSALLSPHLEGEPAAAEHLQGLHGGVLDQLPLRVKRLQEEKRRVITWFPSQTHLIFRDAVDAHCGDGCEHNPDGEQAEEFAGDGVPRVLQTAVAAALQFAVVVTTGKTAKLQTVMLRRREDGAVQHLPEGEDAELLHDVKFSSLVEVEDVWEQAGVPVKVKLLLVHVVVIAHLQERGGKENILKRSLTPPTHTHLQYVLLRVTGQQLSQSGVGEFLQRAGAEAPLQTTDVHVDQDFIRVLVDPAGQTLLHHGNLVTQQRHIVNTETYVEQTKAVCAFIRLQGREREMQQHFLLDSNQRSCGSLIHKRKMSLSVLQLMTLCASIMGYEDVCDLSDGSCCERPNTRAEELHPFGGRTKCLASGWRFTVTWSEYSRDPSSCVSSMFVWIRRPTLCDSDVLSLSIITCRALLGSRGAAAVVHIVQK
ncbi:hypothetical protein INR49_000175 [Caranx melampygus]|nr:hypothetical protein INR49_000175 [Caranx melampygus]